MRGGSFIIFFSFGSNVKAISGRPSVTKFIQRICAATRGRAISLGRKISAPIMTITSLKLSETRYKITFLIFSKITRPCSTAVIIVLKLLSSRTISAVSCATSVPLPRATPMSADLSAGASFTPSPVIATTSPLLCQASTILDLCDGETRA